MIVTPTEYLALVDAHRNKTVFFSPGFCIEETWYYKGTFYTPEMFNKKYPHPSNVGNGEVDARKEFRIQNPDSSKDWMR